MKQHLTRMSRYNAWANERMIEVLSLLSEEQVDQEIESSFPSIRKTVLHIWGAEDVWLLRMKGQERPAFRGMEFSGTFKELLANWRVSSSRIYFRGSTNAGLYGVITYDPLLQPERRSL